MASSSAATSTGARPRTRANAVAAVSRVRPAALRASLSAIRKREDGMALAMSFDLGRVRDGVLEMRAMDLVTGLLYVRGFRAEQHKMLVDKARDWADRWWKGTLGLEAVVVESPLWPDPQCEGDDLTQISDLAALAWCVALEVCKRRRPTPDLMTAVTAEGLSLASIHDEPWTDAFRESLETVMERMRTQPPGSGSRSHAYVEMHLEGSSVEPWSLPERSCVFGTLVNDPDWTRVYVVLKDTAEKPNPQTARTLLRLMLASGADA